MQRHERRLLGKAAISVEGRISIKQTQDRAWPRDHARLRILERAGSLQWVGTQAGPHIGGTFATWEITERGRARLGDLEPEEDLR